MDPSIRYANALFLITLLAVATFAPYGLLIPTATATTPEEDWEEALRAKQSPIRTSAFGTSYTNEFIRLYLGERPVELQQVTAFGPSGEQSTWHTAYLGPEMFSGAQSGELTAQQIQDLDSIRAQAHIVVGTLTGPNGEADVVGLYYSVADEHGIQYHHFVQLGRPQLRLCN